MTKYKIGFLHFYSHRIYEYLSFWLRLPYHVIFHEQEYGYTIKGFIICDCGYVVDLGVSYGLHCEGCYAKVTKQDR